MNPDRMLQFLDEGRLLRFRWGGETAGDGLERACAYVALYSDRVRDPRPNTYCPAEDMPHWFASIIPLIDDFVLTATWEETIRLLASALRRKRSAEDWYRLRDVLTLLLHKHGTNKQAVGHETAAAARRRLRDGVALPRTWVPSEGPVMLALGLCSAKRGSSPEADKVFRSLLAIMNGAEPKLCDEG